jgi:hypothetical protein
MPVVVQSLLTMLEPGLVRELKNKEIIIFS